MKRACDFRDQSLHVSIHPTSPFRTAPNDVLQPSKSEIIMMTSFESLIRFVSEMLCELTFSSFLGKKWCSVKSSLQRYSTYTI